MRRFAIRFTADVIAVFHLLLMALILVGWLLPDPYYYIYLAALSITFFTQIVFRCCILTRWEFNLRRRLDPSIGPSPYYLTYYMHRYFPVFIPTEEFIDRVSLIFMAVSLAFAALHLANDLH